MAHDGNLLNGLGIGDPSVRTILDCRQAFMRWKITRVLRRVCKFEPHSSGD
jgi:hypothetical protein